MWKYFGRVERVALSTIVYVFHEQGCVTLYPNNFVVRHFDGTESHYRGETLTHLGVRSGRAVFINEEGQYSVLPSRWGRFLAKLEQFGF